MGNPIVIEQNTWIGVGATILPVITVGENAVVAAGALVNKGIQQIQLWEGFLLSL